MFMQLLVDFDDTSSQPNPFCFLARNARMTFCPMHVLVGFEMCRTELEALPWSFTLVFPGSAPGGMFGLLHPICHMP